MSLISNVSSRVSDHHIVDSAKQFLNTPAKKMVAFVAVVVLIALGIYLLRRCCSYRRFSVKASQPLRRAYPQNGGGLGSNNTPSSRLTSTSLSSITATPTLLSTPPGSHSSSIVNAGVVEPKPFQHPQSELTDSSKSSTDIEGHPELEPSLDQPAPSDVNPELEPSLDQPKLSDVNPELEPSLDQPALSNANPAINLSNSSDPQVGFADTSSSTNLEWFGSLDIVWNTREDGCSDASVGHNGRTVRLFREEDGESVWEQLPDNKWNCLKQADAKNLTATSRDRRKQPAELLASLATALQVDSETVVADQLDTVRRSTSHLPGLLNVSNEGLDEKDK